MTKAFESSRRDALQLAAALSAGTLVAGVPGTGLLAQSSRGLTGHPAPELDVGYWIDGDGEPASFSIKENAGKWIFLKCFQNWCPGCHSSGFPTLQRFSSEFYGHPKVAIAGIQTVFEGFRSNTQDDVRKLQLRYELPNVMGHDAGNPDAERRPDTMIKYRTGGTPWLILIDPEGTVAFNDFHVNQDKLIEFIHEQIA